MRRLLLASLTFSWLVFGAGVHANAENLIAITFGLNQTLFNFDSLSPSSTGVPRNITGLLPGEAILDIDFRPANGQLYGLSNASRLYTIDPATGAATFVSALSIPLNGASLGSFPSVRVGIDFNPVVDRLRVVSNLDQNLRVNVDTGDAITDGTLRYAAGDPNVAINPSVLSAAYSNNFAGAPSTTLYDLDGRTLVIQSPPNDGTLNTVGSLGTDALVNVGFDISGLSGAAYGALDPVGISQLFTINLNSGLATFIGTIGTSTTVVGLAAPVGTPVPEPATMLLFGTGLVGMALKARRRRGRRKAGRGGEG